MGPSDENKTHVNDVKDKFVRIRMVRKICSFQILKFPIATEYFQLKQTTGLARRVDKLKKQENTKCLIVITTHDKTRNWSR